MVAKTIEYRRCDDRIYLMLVSHGQISQSQLRGLGQRGEKPQRKVGDNRYNERHANRDGDASNNMSPIHKSRMPLIKGWRSSDFAPYSISPKARALQVLLMHFPRRASTEPDRGR